MMSMIVVIVIARIIGGRRRLLQFHLLFDHQIQINESFLHG